MKRTRQSLVVALISFLTITMGFWLGLRTQREFRRLATQLNEQILGIGQRESELESQVADLRKQELELEEQVDRLGKQEQALESQVRGIGEREGRLQREIDHLRDREAQLESMVDAQSTKIKELQEESGGSVAHWALMIPHKNFNILLHLAQQQLSGIAVPNRALRDPKRLNSAMEANWLRDTWRAIGSLHEYASTDHEFRGDYLGWTRSGASRHAWHISRIAMSESDVTMQRHGATREFPIDTRIDPSGRIEMQAHLKIEATGKVRPRVFFRDDTEGETGLVHIGFIGPHDLVPVASHK